MSRHRGQRRTSRLDDRLEALNEARELAEGVLPAEALSAVYGVLDRAASRRSLSREHTVVGFFGATGSGKSSLFNAVLGERIATAAVTRPTTDEPLAAVWGAEGSGPLLDWLGVARRHLAPPVEGFADERSGIILLDLPDFDSTVREHRETVERLVGMVDVLVWVLDPQKYADDALHAGFLAPLAGRDAVTLAVLNQTDRLGAEDLPDVLASLRSLLDAEGLEGVDIVPASALTGHGVGAVRGAIRRVAAGNQAAAARLAAEVTAAARTLAAASGDGTPAGASPGSVRRLADQLGAAANVPLVVEAVRAHTRREAAARTGWPLIRWVRKVGRDPLARLGLTRTGGTPSASRTSLPPPSPAERARTDAAVRGFADAASEGAPGPWRALIRSAAREGRDRLSDALDLAVAGTDLGARRRAWWWGLANAVQWLALVTAVGGLVWLGAFAGLGFLQLPVPETPRVEGWPVPTLLIVAGIVTGLALSVLLAPFAALSARRRAAKARRRLTEAVRSVAQREVVDPVREAIGRHAGFVAALEDALG
ncbi:GTPase [Sinomonas sp. B1-1]|uniref:GTPase n=1 Tax=Sinomonas sp. B1-1 TaxID=3141454 RepID=UPI003D2AEF59